MHPDNAVSEITKRISALLKKQAIVFVGIAGGTGSGKTFIAKKLNAKMLSMDDYYVGKKRMEDGNFDQPSALDLTLLREHLLMLKQNKSISKPVYDFKTHDRQGYEKFEPANILIIEGLFTLNSIINDVLDIRVFMDAPKGTRLERRMERDIKERGRTKENVLDFFNNFAEPMYIKHVLPTKEFADFIIEN